LWEKGRQLAESVRLLQAFTQLGWASALDRDEMMHLVLFGDRSLPGDYTAPRGDLNGDTGRRYLQTAYAQAVSNYAGCAQAVDWDPCQGLNSGFDAKQGQNPYFACGQVDRPNAPVDPLGRCVYAVAGDRTNELAGRYAHWSAEIAGGRHREGIPEVTTVTNLLRITNEHRHCPGSARRGGPAPARGGSAARTRADAPGRGDCPPVVCTCRRTDLRSCPC
ncbi:hypothetical protein KBX53_31280, partial [Micromonospora sp. M51]|uniref:hypothetical protein n=1 Tax=Micromonospora sp. M51 TaxID=2824889 RepID=UPI001B35EDF0